MKYLHVAALCGLLLLFAGCVTVHKGAYEPVSLDADWVMLPFINNTETPYAAERAEAITASLLYARGVKKLAACPREGKEDEISVGRKGERQKEALEWARKNRFRYALAGSVNEWRYKVGLDGEPVVGMTLQILELPEGRVVWSATGAKSGWSRDAVSAVAQQVIDRLLETIQVK
jgi:hypothetical protein